MGSRGKRSPDNVAHRPRSMSLETDEIDFLALFFRFILYSCFFFAWRIPSLSRIAEVSRFEELLDADVGQKSSRRGGWEGGTPFVARWNLRAKYRSHIQYLEYPYTFINHARKTRSMVEAVKCKIFSARLYQLLISHCIQCISLSELQGTFFTHI